MSYLQTILDLIRSGAVDEFLDLIGRDVLDRKKYTARQRTLPQTLEEFPVGCTVRFKPSVRPRYLAGHTATVTGHDGARKVRLAPIAMGRFEGRGEVRCPVNLIERLTPLEPAPQPQAQNAPVRSRKPAPGARRKIRLD